MFCQPSYSLLENNYEALLALCWGIYSVSESLHLKQAVIFLFSFSESDVCLQMLFRVISC